ncbi:MAG: glycosyltransferase family 4 protein [Isosphaeraceae bacterium]
MTVGVRGGLANTRWAILTGEYPPQRGGVSDYSRQVAEGLAAAGIEVDVYVPPGGPGHDPATRGVTVRRLPDRFGLRGLRQLDRELDRNRPDRILIQYVPHAYGCKAMNLPFAAWALRRSARGRDDVRVMFHEVAFPWVRRPLRHNLVAAANRAMAALLVRACSRAYVSIPGWIPLLRRLGAGRLPIAWTPIPSNVPAEACPAAVASRRAELTGGDPSVRVVGHFGTYGSLLTRDLGPIMRELLGRRADVRVLLLGAGGDRWRGELAGGREGWDGRVIAPGALPGPAIAEYLRACDLVVQPYPDGASSRRGSLMAALANGVPVVTTIGALSEPLWSEGATAAAAAGDVDRIVGLAVELLDRPERLAELGQAGRRLYEDRFDLRHTVAALLDSR